MASSSVSQDDIDNDFEKNSRRSRIRTARARQINPSGCRMESNQVIPPNAEQVEHVEIEDQNGSGISGANYSTNASGTGCSDSRGGASGGGANNAVNKYDKLVAAPDENAEHETSPKPIIRSGKEKRPQKMHHANKGKQQRDRRKLREKRRSTGVVHLASTESTGGSTTGDDEESSDAAQGQGGAAVDKVLLETRRNTYQNESIANSYRQAQEKLGWSNDCDSQPENNNGGALGGALGSGGPSGSSGSSSLYPPSLVSFPPRTGKSRRNKSPSDLEADDENDHDSLNQSETGSNLSLSGATPTASGATPTLTTVTSPTEQQKVTRTASLTNSNTPVVRPTTPIGEQVEDFSRVCEENKRLHSMLEEKDRRIHLLEFKVNQLMKDTRTIAEENARYQKENSTLVKALSTLTSKDTPSKKT